MNSRCSFVQNEVSRSAQGEQQPYFTYKEIKTGDEARCNSQKKRAFSITNDIILCHSWWLL